MDIIPEKTAEEIVWGIQLLRDVNDEVDPDKGVRERKKRQFEKGLKLLKNATPALSDSQRSEMTGKIAASNDKPFPGGLSYQAYLFNLASEILSRDSYERNEARRL